MKTGLDSSWARHWVTLLGASVLAVSYGVLALRAADVVPHGGVWGALMIPGYLTLLAGAFLSTMLFPTILFIPIGALLWIAPFAAVDLLLRRLRKTTHTLVRSFR